MGIPMPQGILRGCKSWTRTPNGTPWPTRVMHQPPIIPNIERLGGIYGEIEHLLGLLDGGDVGNDASGAVCLFDLIAN